MRSFFSPFSSNPIEDTTYQSFVAYATLFSQYNKWISLITIDRRAVIDHLGWEDKRNFKFTAARLHGKPFLFIEPSLNKTNTVLINGGSYFMFRCDSASFLPAFKHKRTSIVGHYKEGAMLVELPSHYPVKNEYVANDDYPDFTLLHSKLVSAQ